MNCTITKERKGPWRRKNQNNENTVRRGIPKLQISVKNKGGKNKGKKVKVGRN